MFHDMGFHFFADIIWLKVFLALAMSIVLMCSYALLAEWLRMLREWSSHHSYTCVMCINPIKLNRWVHSNVSLVVY